MPVVIDFTPSGEVSALHRDVFDLGFLGDKTVTRASEIKFNEESQKWDIWLLFPDEAEQEWICGPAKGFVGYDVARKVEVAWLDACRLAGVDPTSAEGICTLSRHRLLQGN